MDRTQDIALLLGRILMSWIFISGGWGKLLAATATQAAFGQRYGLPLPLLAWLVAVVVELGGGVALLLGLYTRCVGLVLAIWCVAPPLSPTPTLPSGSKKFNFIRTWRWPVAFFTCSRSGRAFTAWIGYACGTAEPPAGQVGFPKTSQIVRQFATI